jgi:hypothetical protein
MTPTEFEELKSASRSPAVICAAQLTNKTPRTLVYGYTLERQAFHVYLGHDGVIHVLVYRDLHTRDESPRFLVLSHSGPEGLETKSNHRYLPSKRAYPESCDLEFCKLLQETDAKISFTSFTEGGDERRKEVHSGFAGYTADHPGAIPGVLLNAQVQLHPQYPPRTSKEYSGLSCRLLLQAASDLDVPADVFGVHGTIVAKARSEEVFELACTYLKGIKYFEIDEESFVEALAGEMLGPYLGGNIRHGSMKMDWGFLYVELETPEMPFLEGENLKHFAGKDGAYAKSGVVGEFEGQPFFAVQVNDGITHLYYLQFGDRERFIARHLRSYRLEPVEAVAT